MDLGQVSFLIALKSRLSLKLWIMVALMLKGSELYGVPVFLEDSEESTEHIEDWIVDLKTNQLLGFLVERGGWAGGARILPWENIRQITPQRVDAGTNTAIIRLDRILRIKQILEDTPTIVGASALSKERWLGEIVDVYFHADTGEVTGYALTNDSGSQHQFNQWFVASAAVHFHNGFAVIGTEAAAAIQEHGSPLSIPSFPPDTDLQTLLDATLGLRTRITLRGKHQLITVPRGQLITRQVLETVHEHDQETALLEAVGIPADR